MSLSTIVLRLWLLEAAAALCNTILVSGDTWEKCKCSHDLDKMLLGLLPAMTNADTAAIASSAAHMTV